MTEENKAVVRRLVHEVINKGRLEVADELFTPEGVAGAREAFTNFRSAFPDWREDIVDLIAEGDKVVGHFTCTGTLQGEFMGMPSTGKRMEIDEVYILRIEGGRIVEYWGIEDNLTRLTQLGLMPESGER